jgi:hypothetical protein
MKRADFHWVSDENMIDWELNEWLKSFELNIDNRFWKL